jgi:hypothetical protein
MSVQQSVRSFVGIAKEVTKGTPIVPTDFLPVAKDSVKPADVIDALYDTGLRGSNVLNYNYLPGRAHSTFDFGGAVFADTIGYPLAGLLGGCATVGASAPYTHTISLLNSQTAAADDQPIAYTITDFYAAAVRAYPGCQFSDFNLKFNADGMLEFDTKTTGWLSGSASTPTASFSTILPTQVWKGVVSVGGSTVANAMTGNINMKRPVSTVFGISNTQNPASVFLGPLEVNGGITFIMEDNAELTRYLTNTQPAIVLDWSYGAGAAAVQIQATLTKGAYTAAVIERGDDYVKVTVTINGMGNTTDAGASGGQSSIKWVLKNAKPASTYI